MSPSVSQVDGQREVEAAPGSAGGLSLADCAQGRGCTQPARGRERARFTFQYERGGDTRGGGGRADNDFLGLTLSRSRANIHRLKTNRCGGITLNTS